MVSGVKRQKQEDTLRKRQADTADQEATVRLANEGYTRLQTPTIVAPPDQSFASRVGSYLHGGPPDPSTFLVKDHPSSADEAAARNEAFITSRDAAISARDLQVAGVRVAGETARDAADRASREKIAADTQAGENYRAGLYRATSKAALGQTAKHSVVDDAIDATGGYAQKAWDRIPPAVKKQYGLTPLDMNAGTQRFMDRKAQLTREGMQSREDIAAQRGGGFLAPPGVKAPPAAGVVLPPLADSDKQAAATDPGFAAHLAQRGYVKGRDF
jgi:hypothetical protein